MKNIIIITTGGTIAGVGNIGQAKNYVAGKISLNQILDSIPNINNLANISGVEMFNICSSNMSTDNLTKIVLKINELAEDDSIDGFVITHGTDTLEETAYFLNLTAKTKKPIVITGAMRPSTATSADGPQNLYDAVSVASSEKAVGKGVLVVFGNSIYNARETTKISTSMTVSFGGKDFGMCGYVCDNIIEMVQISAKIHTHKSYLHISKHTKLPKVDILYYHVDAPEEFLLNSLNRNDVLVIAGVGNGGIGDKWRAILNKDIYSEKVIVLSSRISNGIVVTNSDMPKNCIVSGTLNPQKSRILLQLAFELTKNRDEIEKIFELY